MGDRREVVIVGGGLAGCEAAYRVARAGAHVLLYEMKPERYSPAHSLETLAELVCSNSLKSEDLANAAGLLKEEMRRLGSIVIEAARATRVAAGNTLAVDREGFSRYITDKLVEAGVEIVRREVTEVPAHRPLIIATGPLSSENFSSALNRLIGSDNLYFYDAVAPIVYADSIDMGTAFMATRYGKGDPDYINCPLSMEGYNEFVAELVDADTANAHEFAGASFFEGCMPIEVMARRGEKTLMFGPMRPVGLMEPSTGRRPYAVVQLRRENAEGTLYNMVGFQTRLKYPEQKRVFRLIPGLHGAEFARLGKMHRNTYIDSPRLLDPAQQLTGDQGLFFAGQITGVEGYAESAASGILAGLNAVRVLDGRELVSPPASTMTGALMEYISTGGGGAKAKGAFQPMNANFGLLPDPGVRKKRERRQAQIKRALEDFDAWHNDSLAT
jgi:methylenetetrahydrofolate--tRNA-(uracil-5-)-methyltransferase